MPTATFTGIIRKINPLETIKTFEKRTFLLAEEKDSYPSVWQLETQQKMCAALDSFSIGDKVECQVDITGREWQDKAFNTLKCFRINKLQAAAPVQQVAEIPTEPVDDLPF